MPESWNINILMPLRESIRDPSTNPPKPMFQLSGVHCITTQEPSSNGPQGFYNKDSIGAA